jgi:hypothetical protein
MRTLTNTESQFTAGGNFIEALATTMFLGTIATICIVGSLSPTPYYVAKTPNCGWQPYLREQRTPLYDAYGNPTGLDDVVTIQDHQWVCV